MRYGMLSNKNECVKSVCQAKRDNANQILNSHSQHSKLPDFGDLVREIPQKGEQISSQKPNAEVVYPVDAHQTGQVFITANLLALLAWLK